VAAAALTFAETWTYSPRPGRSPGLPPLISTAAPAPLPPPRPPLAPARAPTPAPARPPQGYGVCYAPLHEVQLDSAIVRCLSDLLTAAPVETNLDFAFYAGVSRWVDQPIPA
jgi:hypothetical protein